MFPPLPDTIIALHQMRSWSNASTGNIYIDKGNIGYNTVGSAYAYQWPPCRRSRSPARPLPARGARRPAARAPRRRRNPARACIGCCGLGLRRKRTCFILSNNVENIRFKVELGKQTFSQKGLMMGDIFRFIFLLLLDWYNWSILAQFELQIRRG